MISFATVTTLLMVLMFYASVTEGQGDCSQCTEEQCRPVSSCQGGSNTACIIKDQCVSSSLVVRTPGSGGCLEGEVAVLTRVSFLYTSLQCSPDHPGCQGPSLHCRHNVCCSSRSRGSVDEDSTPKALTTPPSTHPCPPACRMQCEFGPQYDVRGCPLCVCRPHPCVDVNCGVGSKCSVTRYPCENGTCYAPQCLPDDPPGPRCAPVTCDMVCNHGWLTDPETGCPLCQCRPPPPDTTDLCQGPLGLKCPSDRRCEMQVLPCFSPPCPEVPVCVKVPVPRTPCARLQCRMFCPHGFARDANNCEICTCNTHTNCSQLNCVQGKECQVVNNTAICVDKPKTPCARAQCRMFCPHGFARDANNCETCTCNTPPDCSQMECSERKECKVINNEAVCVDKADSPCARISQCRMFCPHGFARDANSCETCTCNTPPDCSQMVCGEGRECQMNNGNAVCVDKPETPCARAQCRMFCPHGFARDANNCETCTCNTPPDCSQMDCGAGRECRIINEEPLCVENRKSLCARLQCRMFCPHGFARDANNCETCTCNTPPDCSQMNCGERRECEIINGEAVCVDKPKTPCARAQCRMLCPHGFARDANNCETCTCNTPPDCSQLDCGAGRECRIINEEPLCVDVPQYPCARLQCRLFCSHGFARDTNNCEVCDCNPPPSPNDCSRLNCVGNTVCAYRRIANCWDGPCMEAFCADKSPEDPLQSINPYPTTPTTENPRLRMLACFIQQLMPAGRKLDKCP
ncbi:kielin/chordin-like protein [Babylonia areolata]|uniref:kielin/chordin-like protein n=1 Tax=Babylonia areolata TaxID=304850 RepID=UPI003FD65EC4